MNINKPKVSILKNPIPVIYLDTCLMIELSKYDQGHCTDKHKLELGELYDKLLALMKSNQIICALGNQMEEMGSAKDREKARNFLYRFTNLELFSPNEINSMQLDAGYRAFAKDDQNIRFNTRDICEAGECYSNSSIKIHVPIIYKEDKIQRLKEAKKHLATDLNDLKNSSRISRNYEEQLAAELKSDFTVFIYNLEHGNESIESLSRFLDECVVIYKRVGIDISNTSYEGWLEAIRSHCEFLLSEHHHKLPYIWIRSVLFAKLMQRPNKVRPSDNLDITWASAYLPFIDYAVTDIAFCDLLKSSGLAEQYDTKVYDVKTLSLLLNELESCINRN